MRLHHAGFFLLAVLAFVTGCRMGQGPNSISAAQNVPISAAGCTTLCHNPAVPPDPAVVSGSGTAGKHIAHLAADITCSKCHNNYQGQATHDDGTAQTTGFVIFDPTNPSGRWDAVGKTCASITCHSSITISWNSAVAGTNCAACHTAPRTGAHSDHSRYACSTCHSNYQGQPTHQNGRLDTTGFVFFDSQNPSGAFNYSTQRCSSLSCHGGRTW
jgi:predicted CxxxxCH...CXXCH cytochrome family protein